MAFNYSPKVVTGSSLVLCLDAANTKSFVSGGSVWTDIANGYTGALNNNTFDSANGGSLAFNGTSAYVNIENIGAVTDFTIEIWFNTAGSVNTYEEVIGSGSLSKLSYTNATKKMRAFIGTVAFGNPYHESIATIEPNTWNCVHYVYDNTATVGQWFINATADSTRTKSIVFSTNPLYIGSYSLSGPTFFNGKVSRVLIYNRVLSSSEISKNYNAIKSRYGL